MAYTELNYCRSEQFQMTSLSSDYPFHFQDGRDLLDIFYVRGAADK